MSRASLASLLLVSSFGLPGCGGHELISIAVDLVTDLEPGLEFAAVEVKLSPDAEGEPVIRETSTDVATGRDLARGLRVATFDGLEPGRYRISVDLVALDGAPVIGREVVFAARSNTIITAVVTRSCVDLGCPGPGDPSNATTCHDGMCVDPRCRPEDPTYCPEGMCLRNSDCKPEEGRTIVCASGVCLSLPATDAGVADAGPTSTYSWVVADGCGRCSASCGGGTCSKDVSCERDLDGERVDDSYCSGPRPPDEEPCNTQPCCSTDPLSTADRHCAHTSGDVEWWSFPDDYGSGTGSPADREMCRQDCTAHARSAGLDEWCCDLEEEREGSDWVCGLHRTPETESRVDPDIDGSYVGLGRCR